MQTGAVTVEGDPVSGNVPTALTSFVGREHELEVVSRLVEGERLVTLTGSGGCGKTRLALHVAADHLRRRYPGGVWWVELAPVTSADAVIDQVAAAVGLPPPAGVDAGEALVEQLGQRGATLLVIDNAEHLVAAVAQVVDAVLRRSPDVRVLVTSREPLGLDAELVWRVPSLHIPDIADDVPVDRLGEYEGVRLFVERARRVRPNLVLDDETGGPITSVCGRLDGIPLAIELAAARLRNLSLDRLASGLDDAFKLLTAGPRTAMPRQQTLLASIAWSYDLLQAQEQAVLRRLAVFSGPFELEAAERVAADDSLVSSDEVLERIGRLVDKSLVLFDATTGRYRCLETIRQFCWQRLEKAEETTAARRRHGEWFAQWCESLGRGAHDFDIGPGHPLLPDVFLALDWAYEAEPAFAYRISRGLAGVRPVIGRFADFERQYQWLASRAEVDDPHGWACAVGGLSHLAASLGRVDFFDLQARAEAMVDRNDVGSYCFVRLFPETVACLVGETRQAATLAALAEEAGDDHAARALAIAVGVGCVNAGQLDEVDTALGIMHRMLKRRGLRFDHESALALVGVAAFAASLEGDLERAGRIAATPGQRDATQVLATNAYLSMVALYRGDLALVEQLTGQQASAERALEAQVRSSGERAALEGPALAVHYVRALLEGRSEEALSLLRSAYPLVPVSPALRTYVLVPLAVALLAAGDAHELDRHLAATADDVARLGEPPLPLTDLHYVRALTSRARSDLDDAWQHGHRALEVAARNRLRLRAIDALHLLGALAGERGQHALAVRLHATVAAERMRIGYVAVQLPDSTSVAQDTERLRQLQPSAWTEGARLDLDDAISLARRGRGERSKATTGWASLTPTERRVAATAAQGLSNPDIGRALLMSLATVKTHLSHVYAKTGVASRTQLIASMPRHLFEEPSKPS